jgi:hypothetical protein
MVLQAGWVFRWCSSDGGRSSNSNDVVIEMEVRAIAAMCMGMWPREHEGSVGDEACS